MNLIKCFLVLVLFATGYCFAQAADSSEMARAKASSNAVEAAVSANADMTEGYDPARTGYGISGRNQLFAKISYVVSLVFCVATLVMFFIARLNAKKNYAKAKKFLMIGLALFAVAIATFLLPKMFLSTTFPGNFDMRAT